jgi:CubicO group peptidase (beta-lactamase class C family)
MAIDIIGDFDRDTLYCTGSFTKLMTTFVTLSLLSEKFDLYKILDDDNFLDSICTNNAARDFLTLLQQKLGRKFSLHDLCSYYSGLPYTFDVSADEIESADAGNPFKHHSVPDEKTFLELCRHDLTPVYPGRGKFHYSEIAIICMAYLMEKVYDATYESLYHRFVIDRFKLSSSEFSRTRLPQAYCQDLSDKYDYPAIAIQDHGYFCYSNGYYTTLNDTKTLVEHLIIDPVFHVMTDVSIARAASNRLMNGLTIEIRKIADDYIVGYEGLSYSGCNNWAYSTKLKQGYVTFTNSEEDAYNIIFSAFGYKDFDSIKFDTVPDSSQTVYRDFLSHYHPHYTENDIPIEFQGKYKRVDINDKHLDTIFSAGKNDIIIRNPDEIKFDLIYDGKNYRIKNKDNLAGSKVGFHTAKSGNRYMSFDGNLYKKID